MTPVFIGFSRCTLFVRVSPFEVTCRDVSFGDVTRVMTSSHVVCASSHVVRAYTWSAVVRARYSTLKLRGRGDDK
jgi:hypothetical protein